MASKEVTQIMIGRDRMVAVLRPYLGSNHARERANNIAQALALGAGDPAGVALEMLGNSGLSNTSAIAEEVGRAWQADTRAAGFRKTENRTG